MYFDCQYFIKVRNLDTYALDLELTTFLNTDEFELY